MRRAKQEPTSQPKQENRLKCETSCLNKLIKLAFFVVFEQSLAIHINLKSIHDLELVCKLKLNLFEFHYLKLFIKKTFPSRFYL